MSEKLETSAESLENNVVNKLIDNKFISLFGDFIIYNNLE